MLHPTYQQKNFKRPLKHSSSQVINKDVPPEKTSRRSETPTLFYSKQHCLFCEVCAMKIDPKNPSRLLSVVECRTVDKVEAEEINFLKNLS